MTRKTVKTTKKTAKNTKSTKKPARKSVATAAPTVNTVTVTTPSVTEAEKIWAEIRYRPIEMFALPNQVVEQHCVPVLADPTKLFLSIRSTAVLPSLEASCKDFVVELADKFVIISRRVATPVVPFKK